MTSPGAKPARPALRGRQADSARRRARVIQAISAATATGQQISPSSIARAAKVDRTFLYRHRDLLEQVHAGQAGAPAPAGTGPAASSASLRADLLNAQQRATRLAARVHQLESRALQPPRRARLARIRPRCPRRHRYAQTAQSRSRAADHRSASPAQRTRPGPRRRTRRQPGTHDPDQHDGTPRVKQHDGKHHTCCATTAQTR